MTFSEKMRESLGAEGVRLELKAPTDRLVPGVPAHATVRVRGGTRPAHIEALLVRVVEADRHWLDAEGARLSEEETRDLPDPTDRRHLTAAWERTTVGETRVEVADEIDPGAEKEVEVTFSVPAACNPSAVHRAHTLNIQADVKGQIDPTANARILIADQG